MTKKKPYINDIWLFRLWASVKLPDQLKEKVDLGVGELETLQSVMDEIKAMNKEYASYSGAPEGATVTSRYVFRTKEESSK